MPLGIGIALSPVFISGRGVRVSPEPALIVVSGGYAPVLTPLRGGASAQISFSGSSVAVNPITEASSISIIGHSVAVSPIPSPATITFTGYEPTLDTGGGSFDTNWWWL